jgi:DNA polymerase-3 subunit delta'
MTFDTVLGQARAIRMLQRMLEKDRVPHALLFTGIDGIGRQATAKTLAMALNCLDPEGQNPCNRCRSCRKMASGNHPDLVIVNPAGVFIKIDQIRSLRKHLTYAPVEGGRRIVIINDAHALTAEASNALLKTLEEPPKDTHIILTAPETTDLSATIVSRCQHVCFRPLSETIIAEVLQNRKALDRNAAQALAVLAKGSLGKALTMDGDTWTARRDGLMQSLGGLPGASIPSLFAFAEALSRDKDGLQDTLDMMTMWFRDLLVWRLCPDRIVNRDYLAQIERIASQYTPDELLKKVSAIFAAERSISRNVNHKLALDVMMMNLGGVCGQHFLHRA